MEEEEEEEEGGGRGEHLVHDHWSGEWSAKSTRSSSRDGDGGRAAGAWAMAGHRIKPQKEYYKIFYCFIFYIIYIFILYIIYRESLN